VKPVKKVLFINPVGHDGWDREVGDYLEPYKDEETRLDVVSLKPGLPQHLEYHYYEALIGTELLHTVKQAERDGYDGCVIGCYYDPFLKEAREICERMVVTAPAGAAMHIGTTLAATFSTIVVRRKCIPDMRDNAFSHGFERHLASFRSLEIGVHELQKDPEYTKNRMREAIRAAIEKDGAEAILLGCTIQLGFFQTLQQEFGIPVIDANIAPLKYAEFLCDLKRKAGWYFSKRALYETPSRSELKVWGVEAHFGVQGLWNN
jgi:allantoin racemase